jgi:hypothetical protein
VLKKFSNKIHVHTINLQYLLNVVSPHTSFLNTERDWAMQHCSSVSFKLGYLTEVSGLHHAGHFIPRGKQPSVPKDGKLSAPQNQSGCDGQEKNLHPHQESNPDSSGLSCVVKKFPDVKA